MIKLKYGSIFSFRSTVISNTLMAGRWDLLNGVITNQGWTNLVFTLMLMENGRLLAAIRPWTVFVWCQQVQSIHEYPNLNSNMSQLKFITLKHIKILSAFICVKRCLIYLTTLFNYIECMHLHFKLLDFTYIRLNTVKNYGCILMDSIICI